ncbi:MAG: hypothetical protein AB8H79_22650 [Myxococcota bacterium]
MSEVELEALLSDFDGQVRQAQANLDAQRRHAAGFRTLVENWLGGLLDRIAQRLERSGHEADVHLDAGLTVPEPALPTHHAELRITPRALPGQRVVRPKDRQPLVRFQLDATEGVVRVWARDVSLDGRDVRVGYRNDPDGMPMGVPLDAFDESVVWKHVLDTLGFALRQSAQEDLFIGE